MATSPLLASLMAAVHNARLFDDQKTYVDMPLRAAPQDVATAWATAQLPDPARHPKEHCAALLAFVQRWMEPPESDSRPALVAGWHAEGPGPDWLPRVAAPAIRDWALTLYRIWPALCRETVPGVAQHPERHTMLAAPQPFFIPGARFRECYYWDSYWVVRGLLTCGLVEAARGLVSNLLWLVEQRGFVPNGLRTYYTNRSQPPLLSQMVAAVHEASPDPAFLCRALAALVREHAYWTAPPKAVVLAGADGRLHHLARYWADWAAPRPESWRSDAVLGEGLAPEQAARLWADVAAAAESGWDFSSRWMEGEGGGGMRSLITRCVVPADLNAWLFQMEGNISRFAAELRQAELADQFAQAAARRLDAITSLMWDAASGQWRDLLLTRPGAGAEPGGAPGGPIAGAVSPEPWEQRRGVFGSNWTPLYCGCATPGSAQAAAAVAALEGSGLLQAGGSAVSLRPTGQQWDWPNCWPPIHCMLVEGCAAYGGTAGAALAARLAQQYLTTAYTAWAATGRMFEKFDATKVGAPGGGGEYKVVDGFGWTNGVALLLLEQYGWSPEAVSSVQEQQKSAQPAPQQSAKQPENQLGQHEQRKGSGCVSM